MGDGTVKAMKEFPIVLQDQARETAEAITNRVQGQVIKEAGHRQAPHHRRLHLARLRQAIDQSTKTEIPTHYGHDSYRDKWARS